MTARSKGDGVVSGGVAGVTPDIPADSTQNPSPSPDPRSPDSRSPNPGGPSPGSTGGRGRRRRGRPSLAERAAGGPGTRELILSSARAEFADRGYDKASIRAIARGAGVDPALVHHYFGSKEQVFAAAVSGSFAPMLDGMSVLKPDEPELFGERITRVVFDLWENPQTRDSLLAVVRSAVNNETAARIFRDLVAGRLTVQLASYLDRSERELRVELAVAQLVGTAMLRYVVRAEPIASAPTEQLIARLAPVIQHHLTGE